MKGDAAESGRLQNPLGHSENIRLTVADAESYVLMLLTVKQNEEYYRPMHSASAFLLQICRANASLHTRAVQIALSLVRALPFPAYLQKLR